VTSNRSFALSAKKSLSIKVGDSAVILYPDKIILKSAKIEFRKN
jgi:hypothetical protein